MLETLLSEMSANLIYFFKNVNLEESEKILSAISNCTGSLILTGVGKSGIIAKKIAVTFISTGTKAFYIPPLDALHGDLGIVSDKDIVILLSKSGHTSELLALLPHIKKKGALTIAITSCENSPLKRECDLGIFLPVVKELCPFNLVPTTSTAVQLIFGDILAIALMKKKGVKIEEYALNHPAGTIGKKISLKVEDLMFKGEKLPLCKKGELLINILHLLSSKQCGSLIVVDDNFNLEGIFTDGDLRRTLSTHGESIFKRKIEEVMTKNPKTTIKDKLAVAALHDMECLPLVTVLPVLEGKQVVGLIRMHDIIQAGIKEI